MKIKDKIYGEAEVTASILLELLESPSILRLKDISQFGIPNKYHYFQGYNRFTHSVGVMLLLRRLGATLEEQVAGLLHDVSVLAFSHVSDWVFGLGGTGVESYHDEIHEEFVKKTEIPEILEKHGFDLERILDENNFSLLEKKIPDLCADRVDYCFRELDDEIVKDSLKNLVNYNGQMVFNNKKTAFDFANGFLELQTSHWGGTEGIKRYYVFSNLLKFALKQGIIQEEDFYRGETIILNKLENSNNEHIKKELRILARREEVELNENILGQKLIKKFRHVDPLIVSDNNLTRLSKLNSDFSEIMEEHRKINQAGITV